MARHKRSKDYNSEVYNENATPEQKAREFDEQYGHNRKSETKSGATHASQPTESGKGLFGMLKGRK